MKNENCHSKLPDNNTCCNPARDEIMFTSVDDFEKARFDYINELGERKTGLKFDVIESELGKKKSNVFELSFYMK